MTDTATNLHPYLTHYIAWIKAHERILVITLAAWLAFHFYGSGLNAWIEHDKRVAAVAQTKVQNDATANTQLTQQVADLKQQLATLSAQAQARQQERIVVVQQQKDKNNQAAPTELAQRTTELLKVGPGEVTTLDDKLLFSNAASHININLLEDLGAAQDNLLDTKSELAGCQQLSAGQDTLVAGLRKQIADTGYLPDKDGNLKCQGGLCQADIKVERDKAKKSWRNGFKWGAITGFVGGVVALKKL